MLRGRRRTRKRGACPVCAVKVAARRADDLATVMRAVHDRGGSAFMLTLTMRHKRGQDDRCSHAAYIGQVAEFVKLSAPARWNR